MRPQLAQPVRFEIWRKVVSPTRDVRRGQVVRPKLDLFDMDLFSLDRKVYPARVLRKGWLFGRPAPMLVLPYGIHHSSPSAAARAARGFGLSEHRNFDQMTGGVCALSRVHVTSKGARRAAGANPMQVLVRDNNIDQALRVLKKKMQREGVFREMKRRRFYEKPSEQAAREKSEAVRRIRKLARKQAVRDGLIAAPKRKPAPLRRGAPALPLRSNP
jgi:small subunit ribosomal protein S21